MVLAEINLNAKNAIESMIICFNGNPLIKIPSSLIYERVLRGKRTP